MRRPAINFACDTDVHKALSKLPKGTKATFINKWLAYGLNAELKGTNPKPKKTVTANKAITVKKKVGKGK